MLVGDGLAIAHLRHGRGSMRTAVPLHGIGGLVVLLACARMHLQLRKLDAPGQQGYALGMPGMMVGATVLALFALCIAFAMHVMQ